MFNSTITNDLVLFLAKYNIINGILLFMAAAIILYITKWIVDKLESRIAKKTKMEFDDILVENKVFSRASHLASAATIFWGGILLSLDQGWILFIKQFSLIYLLVIFAGILDAVLRCVEIIWTKKNTSGRVPVKVFVQVIRILTFILIFIAVISNLMGRDPRFVIGSMGAMTAVLLLVFKDSILGLVAGIQIAANDMVRIGDWIEMKEYNADGDIIEISLTTVKVQNWDKTISTIPAYALVSNSVKNWRGMSESTGRRIKRSIHIDISSIEFCDGNMINKFKKFEYLSEYVDKKLKDIEEFNLNIKSNSDELVNGRRLTNIGTFRAYIVEYLKRNPMINKEMTFLVRQLQSTSQGLPIEIYVFSSDKVWANYEGIQADIFDHIFAVIPAFGLRVYQQPSGNDFKNMLTRN